MSGITRNLLKFLKKSKGLKTIRRSVFLLSKGLLSSHQTQDVLVGVFKHRPVTIPYFVIIHLVLSAENYIKDQLFYLDKRFIHRFLKIDQTVLSAYENKSQIS